MSRNDKPAKRGVVHTMKSYRGRHRSKSDEAAHDNDKPFMPPPIIEHPQVCSNEPILVDTQDKLVKAIDHLRSAGTFGYDTEFIGEDNVEVFGLDIHNPVFAVSAGFAVT